MGWSWVGWQRSNVTKQWSKQPCNSSSNSHRPTKDYCEPSRAQTYSFTILSCSFWGLLESLQSVFCRCLCHLLKNPSQILVEKWESIRLFQPGHVATLPESPVGLHRWIHSPTRCHLRESWPMWISASYKLLGFQAIIHDGSAAFSRQ